MIGPEIAPSRIRDPWCVWARGGEEHGEVLLGGFDASGDPWWRKGPVVRVNLSRSSRLEEVIFPMHAEIKDFQDGVTSGADCEFVVGERMDAVDRVRVGDISICCLIWFVRAEVMKPV